MVKYTDIAICCCILYSYYKQAAMTIFNCFIVALFPHAETCILNTYNHPHTQYTLHHVHSTISNFSMECTWDCSQCTYVISIIPQKLKQVPLQITISWLYIESWERGRSLCTPKHSFFLTGIHWRIFLAAIFDVCGN